MNKQFENFREIINDAIQNYSFENYQPSELYEACDYILSLGGKRLRPALCLMGNILFDGDLNDAVKPALAIEYFHNFTLMHDDIMDEAPLRRGKETVHLKYGTDTGILSGDALFVSAYRMFEDLDAEKFKAVVTLFSLTAEQLCEGQQYDKNFETIEEVAEEDYIKMIEYKTAVLVGASLQIGAITAGAEDEDQNCLYEFGRNLGIAFQLQDDYLDVFGDEDFGKVYAGDIIENKKTILYIIAKSFADKQQAEELKKWYGISGGGDEKINAVKNIFKATESDKKTKEMIESYTSKAMDFLEKLKVSDEKKEPLNDLANELMKRKV